MADEFTSKNSIKAWLAWPTPYDTTEDTLIDEIIAGVVRSFQEFTGRDLLTNTFTETLDGKRTDGIPLDNTPVTAVSSLTVDGTTIAAAADSQGYGYMITAKGLKFVGANRGFTRGLQNVVVSYTGGYTTLLMPGDIKNAATRQAAYVYKGRTREGEAGKALGDGQSVSFLTDELLPAVKAVLGRYQRVS